MKMNQRSRGGVYEQGERTSFGRPEQPIEACCGEDANWTGWMFASQRTVWYRRCTDRMLTLGITAAILQMLEQEGFKLVVERQRSESTGKLRLVS